MPLSAATRFATPGRLLLITLCLAQFMLILDVAVVNVAPPAIQGDVQRAPALNRAGARIPRNDLRQPEAP